jgi:hypothetical protein
VVKGKAVGRKLLGEIGVAFSPDTILRWHRHLVAEKWDHRARRHRLHDDRGLDQVRAGTFYLLFVMEVATRRVCLAGCTPNPDERWMK